MKQCDFQIRYTCYDQLDELPGHYVSLVNSAIEAAGDAYAPYSKYHVGASVLLENGEIITGNNQENAAYPSGLCAERVALFYAGSRYPEVAVRAIAVAAVRDGSVQEEPVTPCGACRQVLFEKEHRGGKPIEVILYGSKKILVLQQSTDLLPLPFTLDGAD
ncbi:MAG TPA: cytidine deaminase [Bacteroides sp.]|nr:cytidine deaminase [Bacteroides sp.]